MKRWCLLSLAFLLVLAGCGGEASNNVVLWHVMGGPLGKALDQTLADFQKAQPGIKVTAITMGNYTSLSQKLMASVAAGNQPELAQSYEAWTSQLVEKGAVKPFADFIGGSHGFDSAALADFYPVMLEECSRGGKIVSLPFNKSVPVYYYNKDLFAKAGLDPAKFPDTWEDFLTAALKLTLDKNGDGKKEQWGTAFPVGAAWTFQCMLLQNGGQVFSPDGKKAVFDSPEGIEALQYLVDLVYKHKVAYLTTGFDHQNDFLAGRVAMIQSSSASLAYMAEQKIPFRMGIAPLPMKKKRAVVLSGTNIVMFRKQNKGLMENAWKLVKWLCQPENTAAWSAATSYLPVRRSALEQPALQAKFDKYPGLKSAYQQLEWAYPEPREAAWLTGRGILEEDGIQPALKGVKSAAACLHDAAQKISKQSGL